MAGLCLWALSIPVVCLSLEARLTLPMTVWASLFPAVFEKLKFDF
jgi:hypothetical protein